MLGRILKLNLGMRILKHEVNDKNLGIRILKHEVNDKKIAYWK